MQHRRRRRPQRPGLRRVPGARRCRGDPARAPAGAGRRVRDRGALARLSRVARGVRAVAVPAGDRGGARARATRTAAPAALALVDHAAARRARARARAARRETTSRRSRASRGGTRSAITAYEAWLEGIAAALEPLLDAAPPRWRSRARAGPGSLRAAPRSARSLRLLFGPARAVLEEWFESEPLRATLATDAIIGAFAPPSARGTGYVLFHHVMGIAGGRRGVWAYVAGGMGALSEALASAARAAGAVLRTSAEVAAIRVPRRAARAAWRSRAARRSTRISSSRARTSRARRRSWTTPRWRRRFPVRGLPQPGREAEPRARRAAAVSRAGRRVASALGHDPHRADRPRRHRARVRRRRRAGASRSCRSWSSRFRRSSTRASRRRASTSPRSSRSTRRCFPPAIRAGPRCATPCAIACWPRSTRSRRASSGSIEHLEVLAAPELEREFGLTGGNIFHGAMDPRRLLLARPSARLARLRVAAARALAVRIGDTPRWRGHGRAGPQRRARALLASLAR